MLKENRGMLGCPRWDTSHWRVRRCVTDVVPPEVLVCPVGMPSWCIRELGFKIPWLVCWMLGRKGRDEAGWLAKRLAWN